MSPNMNIRAAAGLSKSLCRYRKIL